MATETVIFRKSYFERTPLTGCYCMLLKRLEPEPIVFENIANHSAYFIKSAQSRTHVKYIFNSNILWNLEFCNIWFYQIQNSCARRQVPLQQFDAHGAKSNLFSLIYFLYCSLQVLWKIITATLFTYNRHWPLHLNENNFSLSQLLQIKE